MGLGFLDWLKSFFDTALVGIPVFLLIWVFVGVALAPPQAFFQQQIWFMERVSTFHVFGQSVVLPNLAWIYGFTIAGSLGTRLVQVSLSKSWKGLKRLPWDKLDSKSDGVRYLERQGVKRFPEEE